MCGLVALVNRYALIGSSAIFMNPAFLLSFAGSITLDVGAKLVEGNWTGASIRQEARKQSTTFASSDPDDFINLEGYIECQ